MTDPAPRLLRLYRALAARPGGRAAFSLAVCLRAPYFRTVRPLVVDLDTGRAVVRMRDRWGVHNHLGTVRAIASCNLAEVAAGVACEVTTPPSHRWIPKGMQAQYRGLAHGTVTGTAQVPDLSHLAPDESREVVVPVDVTTADGTVAVHADITVWLSPRRR